MTDDRSAVPMPMERTSKPGFVTITPHTPQRVADTELDPELVAALDDEALLLSLDAASDDDRRILMAEVLDRGLEV